MTPNKIPFLDLVTPHQALEEELVAVFRQAVSKAAFIGGPMVEGFEREFGAFCDSPYCVGVASGTDAVRFALTAAGVTPGDIVVTVPMTFIATTEAISQAGARPDFVDIHETTCTMDPEKLRAYLEEQCDFNKSLNRPIHKRYGVPVSAIIPVHLYGQCADMDPILDLAAKYNLIVIEDACQAHGAEYFSRRHGCWRKAGTMSHAAAFSFYAGKNLAALGEAGAVTTNDEELAAKVRILRDHGQAKKYYHDMEGYNGRLDAIQAGFLSVKLAHLPDWNAKRRTAAARYNELLEPLGEHLALPIEPEWSRAVYHLYVVRSENRDALREHLAAAGIDSGLHYPLPLHLQKAYESYGWQPGDFRVSERLAAECLSLPMFPELTPEQQQRIAQCVSEFCLSDVKQP